MKYKMDLGLFRRRSHNPSLFSLLRSAREPAPTPLDFCVPCNPYFPTPPMFAEYAAALEMILRHYPSDSDVIARRFAETFSLRPENIVLANGSTELITWIDQLFIRSSMATPVPTFGRWTDQPLESGKAVHLYQLRPENGFMLEPRAFVDFVRRRRARVAVLCNPNNPDGGYLRKSQVLEIVHRLADLDLIVVDESFIDFVEAEINPSLGTEVLERENVLVLKSLGKNFGLHGVRFGYALANPRLAARLRQALPRWNVNALAEAIIFSLKDHLADYRHSLALIARDRHSMRGQLQRIGGLTVYPSQANFFLVKLPDKSSGADCRNHLLSEHGVFIRECGNKKGIDSQYLRLVVRPAAEVECLSAGLSDYLATR